MQPGQVFKPGQADDNRPADDPSNQANASADNTPQTDGTPPAPAQAPSPLNPKSNNQSDAIDIKPSEAIDNKDEEASPPAEPAASPDETVAPTEAVPEEVAATDQQQTPEEEQSSDDQGRADTTPTPVVPPQSGAGVAQAQDPGEQVAQPEPENFPPPVEPKPQPPMPAPPPTDIPNDNPSADQPADQSPDDSGAQFNWEASEYIEHHHSPLWYGALSLLTLGFAAFLVLVFKEILGGIVVVLMAIAVVVYAHRQPRSLPYQISSQGLTIDDKSYSYNQFRSFAAIANKSVLSIELDPTKRFMPRLSILLDPNQAQTVIDILSRYLPHEDRQPEFIDRLAHTLKF